MRFISAATKFSKNASNTHSKRAGLSMAGGEGFEPSTPNLGGWCSIRTELLAQASFKMVLDLPLLAAFGASCRG
jgi:hypothetical protein